MKIPEPVKVGLGVCIGFAGVVVFWNFIWSFLLTTDAESRAYYRRVEKSRIIMKACEARQGMPTFDNENFVNGCEEKAQAK